MENRKTSISVKVFFLIAGIIVLLVAFMAISELLSRTAMGNKVILNDKWDVTINGREYKDVNLDKFRFVDLKRGDGISLKTTGISTDIQATVMLMMIKNCAVMVKHNDEIAYGYGMDLYKSRALTGSGYHRVNLHDLKESDTIEIGLVVGEDNAFSSMDPPEIRDGKTISYEMTEELLLPGALGNFFVIFGVSLVFIAAFLAAVGSMNALYLFKMLCIAIFSLCGGFWVFTASEMACFYTTNDSGKSFVEYLALYMMPLAILGYQIDSNLTEQVPKLRKRLYLIVCSFDALFILFVYINHVLRIHSIVRYLMTDHIISTFILVMIMATQIYDLVKGKSQNLITVSGVLLLVVTGIFEMIRYNFSRYILGREVDYRFSIIFLAGLIFVWSLIIDHVRNALISMKDRAKMEIIERMAYTDAMTGISNRLAAERRYKMLDVEKVPYCIIEFDLNGLKKINDAFGHDEGDDYIRSFANALNNVFEDAGMVSRTGGDEFTVIIDRSDALVPVNLEIKLGELKDLIAKLNEWHEDWNLSAAYGFCFYNEEGVMTVSDAFNRADERMYEMKKEMKKALKKKSKKEGRKKE